MLYVISCWHWIRGIYKCDITLTLNYLYKHNIMLTLKTLCKCDDALTFQVGRNTEGINKPCEGSQCWCSQEGHVFRLCNRLSWPENTRLPHARHRRHLRRSQGHGWRRHAGVETVPDRRLPRHLYLSAPRWRGRPHGHGWWRRTNEKQDASVLRTVFLLRNRIPFMDIVCVLLSGRHCSRSPVCQISFCSLTQTVTCWNCLAILHISVFVTQEKYDKHCFHWWI